MICNFHLWLPLFNWGKLQSFCDYYTLSNNVILLCVCSKSLTLLKFWCMKWTFFYFKFTVKGVFLIKLNSCSHFWTAYLRTTWSDTVALCFDHYFHLKKMKHTAIVTSSCIGRDGRAEIQISGLQDAEESVIPSIQIHWVHVAIKGSVALPKNRLFFPRHRGTTLTWSLHHLKWNASKAHLTLFFSHTTSKTRLFHYKTDY